MKKEIKKFEMHKKPIKTNPFFQLVIWIGSKIMLSTHKYKIVKENFKKIEGGCIVVSNHMSFTDFFFLETILCPRRSFYIVSIDEFIGKEWLMRHIGCIPKKVHYMDMALVRTMVRLLKKGNIVSLYPEATYTFAGVTNEFDQGIGKLAKMANVPVVVIRQNGNYLYTPRWHTAQKNKEVPLQAYAKMVVSQEEVKQLTDKQIQERINEYFEYDDYKYQRENNIHIKNNNLAYQIDRILYRCPHCGKEMCIEGNGNTINCKCCNAKYNINSLHILNNENGETKFDSISDWFLWQRDSVKQEILNGTYNITFPVKISKLINGKKGFDHNFAIGEATQNEKGIFIKAKTINGNEDFSFEYNEKLNSTVHLTYDVRGCQEPGFEVHNATDSYLIYPLDKTSIIKIRFAVEEAHKKYISILTK